MIELVDFNELYNGGKKEVKKAKSRRGGKAKKLKKLLKLLRLMLSQLLKLLNKYVNNYSIRIKGKLFIVYPFFCFS
jgi:hypothetical protein